MKSQEPAASSAHTPPPSATFSSRLSASFLMMSSLKEKAWQISCRRKEGETGLFAFVPGLGGEGWEWGCTPVGSLQLWASGSLTAMLFETLSASGLPQTIRVAEVCFVKSRQQPAPHNGPLEEGEQTIFSLLND